MIEDIIASQKQRDIEATHHFTGDVYTSMKPYNIGGGAGGSAAYKGGQSSTYQNGDKPFLNIN